MGLGRPAQAGVKKGYQLKSGYFTDIGSSSVKTVTLRLIITSINDELFNGIKIDDLE